MHQQEKFFEFLAQFLVTPPGPSHTSKCSVKKTWLERSQMKIVLAPTHAFYSRSTQSILSLILEISPLKSEDLYVENNSHVKEAFRVLYDMKKSYRKTEDLR